MVKLLFILPCLLIMFQPLNAKVEAPNYNFSIDSLGEFAPGKSINGLDKKHGKPEQLEDHGGVKTLKYYVSHIRYKFPVLVNVKEGTVEDFFARLPSYFLHDIFFQSLVNRYGKQKSYKKIGEEAVYVWEEGGFKHIYSAACTITCFPIFYAMEKVEKESPSFLDKMKKGNGN